MLGLYHTLGKARPNFLRARSFSSVSGTGGVTRPSRLRATGKFFGYTFLAGSGIFVFDKYLNASAIGRNVRTLSTGAIIALDYKLNFNAENSEAIPALQERVAERLYNLLTSNGGLYIKIGQAIGANAAILPEPFRVRFGRLFDDAPQVPFEDVERVIKREFGVSSVDDVFEWFDRKAVASASIAQVHRARLKDGKGTMVAVKVQKPDVTKQVNWDLAAYKILMWSYDLIFPMPIYFLADFIASRLKLELDFINEANNAIQTSEYINSPEYSALNLKGRVYIPKVYLDYTTKHVMTAEWIDGVRLSDRKAIKAMEEGSNVSADDSPQLASSTEPPAWRDISAPLRGGRKAIMQTMVDLFCAQMFVFGFIHCDPHPGNILIRRTPSNEPQLVLLDHGLYVSLTPNFRSQYATLWKSLLTLDWDMIRDITVEWGIGTPDLFASATLMRPMRVENNGHGRGKTPSSEEGEEPKKLTQYEIAEKMKEKLKGFLTDTDKMPKELVFLGRNMRIVQGNNQSFGSPVNRIRITASWASRSLVYAPPLVLSSSQHLSSHHSLTNTPLSALRHRVRATYDHMIFLGLLFTMDVAFYVSKLRQWVRGSSESFEDEIERGMRGFAKDNLGVELQGAFEG